MKNFIKFQVLAILCLLWISQVSAQPGRGLNRGAITRFYDTTTVETVSGEITKIDTARSGYGRFPGIILNLKNKKQETKIYLAPLWYLNQEKLQFKTGKSITVTGSKVTYQNKPLIITKDFNYNKKKNTIRNENGSPVWAGKRMGPGRGRRWR